MEATKDVLLDARQRLKAMGLNLMDITRLTGERYDYVQDALAKGMKYNLKRRTRVQRIVTDLIDDPDFDPWGLRL